MDFLMELRNTPYLRYVTALLNWGSIRLLKWARENKLGTQSPWDWSPWNSGTCSSAAMSGHLPALKYLHENGCPWGWTTCAWAADYKRWDCLQYAVDNKCPDWEFYARKYAEHLG